MPLGGSGLKRVWKRPLGAVFDWTCSGELEGTLQSMESPETTLPATDVLKVRKERQDHFYEA